MTPWSPLTLATLTTWSQPGPGNIRQYFDWLCNMAFKVLIKNYNFIIAKMNKVYFLKFLDPGPDPGPGRGCDHVVAVERCPVLESGDIT